MSWGERCPDQTRAGSLLFILTHHFLQRKNQATTLRYIWASQVPLVVKNPSVNAGDARDMGSIPGSGRSPGRGHATPLIFLPGESHGQRRLEGYSPQGRTELDKTEVTQHADTTICVCVCIYTFDLLYIIVLSLENVSLSSKSRTSVTIN